MNLDDCFRRITKVGHSVLDIGAFRGITARVFAECVGPSGRVFAFEPNPVQFLHLANSASQRPDKIIRPFCCAVGDREGHIDLGISTNFDSDQSNQASTIVDSLKNSDRLESNFARLFVEVKSVDAICADFRISPDVIKIDVEGAEEIVIRGASSTLARHRPIVVLECSGGPGEHDEKSLFPRHLESLGYSLYVVDILRLRNQWIPGDSRYSVPMVVPIQASDWSRIDPILMNIVAVPHHLQGDFPFAGCVATSAAVEFFRA